jgi:hypothetical protein
MESRWVNLGHLISHRCCRPVMLNGPRDQQFETARARRVVSDMKAQGAL